MREGNGQLDTGIEALQKLSHLSLAGQAGIILRVSGSILDKFTE